MRIIFLVCVRRRHVGAELSLILHVMTFCLKSQAMGGLNVVILRAFVMVLCGIAWQHWILPRPSNTIENLHFHMIMTERYLDILPIGHSDIRTFAYFDFRTFAYVDLWSFAHSDIWAFGRFRQLDMPQLNGNTHHYHISSRSQLSASSTREEIHREETHADISSRSRQLQDPRKKR